MKTKLLIMALAVISIFSCNNATNKNPENSEPIKEGNIIYKKAQNITGGWSETKVTPEVEKAVDFVLPLNSFMVASTFGLIFRRSSGIFSMLLLRLFFK